MLAWLSEQLDEQNIGMVNADSAKMLAAGAKWFEQMAIAEARRGHPDWLRELYPQFADCISSPKLARGHKYPNQEPRPLPKIAVDYTRRIRALWQTQYGKQKRLRDEMSAEDFAVAILRDQYEDKAAGLDKDAVLRAANPSGKRKKNVRAK
jgi:hypothetical protein